MKNCGPNPGKNYQELGDDDEPLGEADSPRFKEQYLTMIMGKLNERKNSKNKKIQSPVEQIGWIPASGQQSPDKISYVSARGHSNNKPERSVYSSEKYYDDGTGYRPHASPPVE